MVLHSERLYMRQITTGDWPLFLALHADQRVIQYVCDAPTESQTREKFESRLPQWLPSSTHWLCLVMFDIHIRRPVGVTGLKLTSSTSSTAEVGYLLLAQYQGKGYGSESLQTVMTYARDVLGLLALKGVVTDGNSASCHVLEKCGFVLEQRQSDACCINGQLFDDLIYWCRIGEY